MFRKKLCLISILMFVVLAFSVVGGSASNDWISSHLTKLYSFETFYGPTSRCTKDSSVYNVSACVRGTDSPTNVTGKVGSARNFGDTSQSKFYGFPFNQDNMPNGTDPFTVCIWHYNGGAMTNNALFGGWAWTGNQSSSDRQFFYRAIGSDYHAFISNNDADSGLNTEYVIGSGTFDTGSWHLSCLIRNDTNPVNNWDYYMDNELIGTTTLFEGWNINNMSEEFAIGGVNTVPYPQYYSGYLDEFLILNASVDGTILSHLWNSGAGIEINVTAALSPVIENHNILWLNETPFNNSYMTDPNQNINFYLNSSLNASDCNLFVGNDIGGSLEGTLYFIEAHKKYTWNFTVAEGVNTRSDGSNRIFMKCTIGGVGDVYALNRSHFIDFSMPVINWTNPIDNSKINNTDILEWEVGGFDDFLNFIEVNISNSDGETVYYNYTSVLNDTFFYIVGSKNISSYGATNYFNIFTKVNDNAFSINDSRVVNVCNPSFDCISYSECLNASQSCLSATDSANCGILYTGNYSEFPPLSCTVALDSKLDLTTTRGAIILGVFMLFYLFFLYLGWVHKIGIFGLLSGIIGIIMGLMIFSVHSFMAFTIIFINLGLFILIVMDYKETE